MSFSFFLSLSLEVIFIRVFYSLVSVLFYFNILPEFLFLFFMFINFISFLVKFLYCFFCFFDCLFSKISFSISLLYFILTSSTANLLGCFFCHKFNQLPSFTYFLFILQQILFLFFPYPFNLILM